MSKPDSQLFKGTTGAKTASVSNTKVEAMSSINTLPSDIQSNIKDSTKVVLKDMTDLKLSKIMMEITK